MFEKLLSIFSSQPDYQTPVPEADANHAFGALLVRVAKADRAYLFEELERIDKILADHVGLNPVEAAKFRAECEKLEEAMPETGDLSRILAEAVDQPTRETMFHSLWEVLVADGFRHESEEGVVARVAQILNISPARAAELAKVD